MHPAPALLDVARRWGGPGLLAALLVLPAACRRSAPADEKGPLAGGLPPAASGYTLTQLDPSSPLLPYHGISDVARDDSGTFWFIEETGPERHLTPLTIPDGGAPFVPAGRSIPIRIDPDLDSESLAVLGPRADGTGPLTPAGPRFAVGTEGSGGRTEERIFLFDANGSPSGSWQYRYPVDRSESNHGIEAMCSLGSSVLVAIEHHVDAADHPPFRGYVRAAIVGDSAQRDGRFYVTSDDGVLSGMACRPGSRPGTYDIVAIESRRPHTRKSRLIRATWTPGDGFEIVPDTWWVDLNATFGEPPDKTSPELNFEGVAWIDRDSWLLVNDDQLKNHPPPGETHVYRLLPK